jgi:hypothetical protein
VAAPGRSDRIDVADDVGDSHIRRCQLLHIPLITRYPIDRRLAAHFLQRKPTVLADGMERIVVDFRAGDDRDFLVE